MHRRPDDRARRWHAAVPVALLLGVVACSPAGDGPRPAPSSSDLSPPPRALATTGGPDAVPGEWLVKFEARFASSGREKLGASLPVRIKQTYRSVPGLHLVQARSATDPGALSEALQTLEGVEYVEPNYIYRAFAIPNDPEFPRQRGLNNVGQFSDDVQTVLPDIEAPAAWDVSTGSDDLVVAIIDSGIDLNHEDLRANLFRNESECVADGVDSDGNGYVDDCHGIDAVNGDSDPSDDDGHGTHVAGIAGAVGNNAIGIAGVAWRVKLLPCKFLGSDGYGTTADAIRCLDYVATMQERGAKIVATNNSWGDWASSRALDDAIAAQMRHGILFVAAAGNGRDDNDLLPTYPCATDHANVICVADAYDQVAIYSSYGVATVHLGAPGTAVLSTMPGNRYEMLDGTSMAAPHVTGALVLLAAQDPQRDWRALRNLVLSGTRAPTFGPRMTLTNGRLDASRALNCQDSTILARMRPTLLEPVSLPQGAPLSLKALHVRCASPAGPVTVGVSPSGEVITLRDDGIHPDEAVGDGVYSAAWVSQRPGTYTLTFDTPQRDALTVNVDAQLRIGFPLPSLGLPSQASGVRPEPDGLVVGNVSGDDALEILTSSYDSGPLSVWHDDGRPVPGWPSYESAGASTLALGEFDGDPRRLEVAGTDKLRGTRLYLGNGMTMPGWPLLNSSTHYGRAPATFDFDGDGLDELLTTPVRRANGSLYGPEGTFPVWGTTPHTAPVVADLDADGEVEVILADKTHVWVSNRHGPFPGFPARHAAPIDGPSPQPVVGDVTGDGRPDIVLIAATYGVPLWTIRVDVIDRRGLRQSGWQFEGEFVTLMPSLADLTGDGIPEILAQDGTRGYAWTGSGQALAGWPVDLDRMYLDGAQPVVGDIDGDRQPDVVFVRGHGSEARGSLQAFSRSGKPLPGYPKPLWAASSPATPAIADLDLDGRNELVVAAMPDYGLRDGVYVYDSTSSAPSGPIEWGQFMEGPSRHGAYRLGKALADDAYLATQVFGAGRIASTDGAIDCGATCLRKYRRGSVVALTATARAGARFARWKGSCTGTASTCTVTMDALREVSADFDSPVSVTLGGAGAGVVTADNGGLSCPGQCTKSYSARSVVTLTAAVAAGSAFDGWGGACAGTTPTCTLVIDDARAVVATFVNERTLTVAAAGTGGGRIYTDDAGIDCGSRCSAGFVPGSTVRLRAAPDSRSYVERWSVPGCMYEIDHCDVAIDDARSVTVHFGLNPVFTVRKSGGGSVRVTSVPAGIDCGTTCSARLPHDSLVEFRASPAADTYVVRWSDCAGASESIPCQVYSGSTDRTVEIETAVKPRVQVVFEGRGTGSVMAAYPANWSCNGNCNQPADPRFDLTIVAQPANGSTFAGWGGACAGRGTSCTIRVASDTSISVTFQGGSGSGSGGGGSTPGGGASGGGSGGGGAASGLLLILLSCLVRRKRPIMAHRGDATGRHRHESAVTEQ